MYCFEPLLMPVENYEFMNAGYLTFLSLNVISFFFKWTILQLLNVTVIFFSKNTDFNNSNDRKMLLNYF